MADALWEQQENESAPAFEAFQKYRDMGAARSTAKVAQQLGKSKTLMDRWSSEHSWVKRALAWDAQQDKEWRIEQQATRKAMARRQATVAAAAQNKIAQYIVNLNPETLSPQEAARWYEVAVKVERQALGEPDRLELTGADGGAIQVENMTPEDVMIRLREIKMEIADTLGAEDGGESV